MPPWPPSSWARLSVGGFGLLIVSEPEQRWCECPPAHWGPTAARFLPPNWTVVAANAGVAVQTGFNVVNTQQPLFSSLPVVPQVCHHVRNYDGLRHHPEQNKERIHLQGNKRQSFGRLADVDVLLMWRLHV